MAKEITAYELAILMQAVNIGEEDEEFVREMTSVGVAIQQKIDEVLKDHPTYEQKDFILAQRLNFEEGLGKLQKLSEYFKGEEDENFNA